MLNEDGLLNIKQVGKLLHISRSTIFLKLKSGFFPKPLKIGRENLWERNIIEGYVKNLREEADNKRNDNI